MWLLGVVVRRYIDFLILLVPTPFVSALFSAASLLFANFLKCFRSCSYDEIELVYSLCHYSVSCVHVLSSVMQGCGSCELLHRNSYLDKLGKMSRD